MYCFDDLTVGDYFVMEVNPVDYPTDVSNQDNSNDKDSGDLNILVDNMIPVTLKPGEEDLDNNFIDSKRNIFSNMLDL
jgi:hypothetical protein